MPVDDFVGEILSVEGFKLAGWHIYRCGYDTRKTKGERSWERVVLGSDEREGS